MLKYLLSFLFTVSAAAQIPCGSAWIPVGSNGSVYCFTEWNGKLVAGGTFTQIGGVNANRVAVFDGQTWAPLGNGFDDTVRALAVANGQLYAGGEFLKSGGVSAPFLARYNGSAWAKLPGSGPTGPVFALAADPDPVIMRRVPSPRYLYAGGTFLSPFVHLTKFDTTMVGGEPFSGMGLGVDGPVYTLSSPTTGFVYVGGNFATNDAMAILYFAVYVAENNEFLPSTLALDGSVHAITYEFGVGGVIGGAFANAGALPALNVLFLGVGGAAAMGAGLNDTVYAVTKYNGLYYAGGAFTKTGMTPLVGLGKFINNVWQPVESGVNGSVRALLEFNGELWVGGDFLTAGGVSSRGLARYTSTGTPWFRTLPGPTTVNSFDNAEFSIEAAVPYNNSGLTYQWLYNGNPVNPGLRPSGATISGDTTTTLQITNATVTEAGNYSVRVSAACGVVYTSPVAALSVNLPDACTPDWVSAFPATPTLDGSVRSIVAWDHDGDAGTPAQTVIAGAFKKFGKTTTLSRIARWDGANFVPLGDGLNNTVNVVESFDADGPGGNAPWLVAGGAFTKSGNVALSRIARWDGATWAALGAGLNGNVNALCTFDFDGAGAQSPQLVAAGAFTKSGSASGINRVARFDGSSWRPIGQGFNGEVKCLLVGDPDGPGPIGTVLIAGGNFTKSGATKLNRVAYWDGTAWQPIADGFNGAVNDMTIIYGSFYCGGAFTKSGTTKINRLAALVDDEFQQIGEGFNNTVNALEVSDLDGLGPGDVRLYAVGTFTKSGTSVINRVAVFNGTDWLPIGAGVNSAALCVRTVDIPAGAEGTRALLIGGDFKTVDGLAQRALAAYRCPANMLLRAAPVRPASIADLCGTGGLDTPPDGQVTIDDVIAFMVAVGEDDPAADLVAKDGADTGPDWQVTIDDVIAFIEAYATSP